MASALRLGADQKFSDSHIAANETAPAPHLAADLAASTSAHASDVGTPDRDLSKLHPQLRDGVHRVTERMRREFGHEVEVMEGFRSPERQAYLFEQGRSRPGPMVTWTRQSQHSQGRAVDLRVDGTWHHPVAYGHLQRIAQEEGLVTLGPRDPGHIQLPNDGRSPVPAAVKASPSSTAPVSAVPASAEAWLGSGMAEVARVASVARPAGIARPARIAVPGLRVRGRTPGQEAAPPAFPDGETPSVDMRGPRLDAPLSSDRVASNPDARPEDARIVGQRREARPATTAPPATQSAAPEDQHRSAAAVAEVERVAPSGAGDRSALASEQLMVDPTGWSATDRSTVARELSAVSGPAPSMMARIEEIEQLRQAAGLAGPSEIRLDLDETDGLGARIRVALRGLTVDAVIDMDDPVAARRLRARISDLHRAMEARGLEPSGLDVRPVRPAGEGSEIGWRSGATTDPHRMAATAASERNEAGTHRESTRGERDQGRREWREFLDGSRRDHRRENDQ